MSVLTEPRDVESAGPVPPEPEARPRFRLTRRWKAIIVLGVLALGFLLPLRGLLRSQGPPMEEGFMLVFPERVLRGDVPNKDFLHLYGPGSLWIMAGWFKAFGVSLVSERLFGLLQMIGLVGAVYGLARFWGRTVALGCAFIALVIIVPPLGLTALAWVGGVALAALGLLVGLHGRRRLLAGEASRAGRLAIAAGFLAGWALLFRLDLVLAVALGGVALAWGLDRHFRRRLLGGLALGAAGYLVHLAMAGPGTVVRGMILDPVIYLRGGRRLPIPPPPNHLDGFLQRSGAFQQLTWPFPSLQTATQLTVWFFALLLLIAFLLWAGRRAVRREPGRFQARVLLVIALFSLGLLPQAMQRVDSAHFAWVSCIPLALLPVALVETFHDRRPHWPLRVRGAIAAALVFVAMVGLVPHFTARPYSDYVAQTFDYHRIAYKISHHGRVFYYGRPEVADAATQMLAKIDTIARPGDRLFVGEDDLRRTNYSDAYLYYLLPDLPPATYFIEMDPGVANRKGSRLASDLRSAQIVILSGVWKAWDEPNDSRKLGDLAPSRVLRDDFCQVGDYGDGEYLLYTKRPKGRPCPAGTRRPHPPGL